MPSGCAGCSKPGFCGRAQIERLSDAIEEQLRPYEPAVELLRTVDGIQTRTAQNILAEIGVDMSVFPTAGHERLGHKVTLQAVPEAA